MGERIQKVLANAGLASRRTVEAWIKEDRVTVNGQPANLGQRITPKDRVQVDGRPFVWQDADVTPQIIAYHKPIGQVCSNSDPDGRPTVFESLPALEQGRWISIGRLDVNTAGLLLFTNDGELANRLMHPKQQLQREYAVRFLAGSQEPPLQRLLEGIELDDGLAKAHGLRLMGKEEGANQWCRITITEGRKREVRRMFEAIGCRVNRLIRVRFGDVELRRDHRIEQVRQLSRGESRSLYQKAGLTVPPQFKDAPRPDRFKKKRTRSKSRSR